jgi:hypothetical protein
VEEGDAACRRRGVAARAVRRHSSFVIRTSSTTFGLFETMRPDYAVLSGAALATELDENRALFTHALPVIETLYTQIAKRHSLIALSDASGLLLRSLDDGDFLARRKSRAARRRRVERVSAMLPSSA